MNIFRKGAALGLPLRAAAIACLALGILPAGQAAADDSCVWAFDGVCDDGSPGSSTSACAFGTDDTDCGSAGTGGGGGGFTGGGGGGGLSNPCPFTNDGDCDEPNGLGSCDWGTDVVDCSNPASNFGSGSGFAGTGGPLIVPAPGGGGGGGGGLSNPCPFTNDGDCDEPNGLGSCDWGTDVVDCSNPASNFGSGSGFAGTGGPLIVPAPGGGGLSNPCPFTNDGDCDEPNGLGSCDWGTDVVDCSNPASNFGSGSGFAGGGGGGGGFGGGTGLSNPCPFTNDGDCDEPNGLGSCDWGTDVVDCSNPASNFGSGSGFAGGGGGGGGFGGGTGLSNPCPFTNDGDCDEPNGLGLCDWGTDVVDCSNPASNFGSGSGFAGGGGGGGGFGGTGLSNPCPFTNDGDCDEPNGLGLCDWGTDVVDCSNPASNFGGGSGFAGGGGGGGGGGFGGLSNPCPFTNDGDCDEPNGLGLCAWGTDVVDCSNPASNFGGGSGFAGGGGFGGGGLANPCPFRGDGDCDEPNGLGLCAWGTDVVDCSNPRSNFGGGSGFINPASPPRPSIPSTQQGIQIQTALNYFQFNAGAVDGQIGPGTRRAIERYQAAMGYPVDGRNLAADQLGVLLGAFTWATTEGGAVQTGLRGTPLLLAYRTRSQTGNAPAQPGGKPGGGGAPAGQPTTGQTGGQAPQQPGRPPRGTGGGATAGVCPNPQNSDGFVLVYNGYSTEYSLDSTGNTVAQTDADDGSFAYDTSYLPLGLMVSTWDSNPLGQPVAGTIQRVEYAGATGSIPRPANGVSWQGTETARYEDGGTEIFSTSVRVGPASVETVGPCSYSMLPMVVSRVPMAGGGAYDEYLFHVVDFGISVFVGFADAGGAPDVELPTAIQIRADDGITAPAVLPAPFSGLTGGAPAPAPLPAGGGGAAPTK
jgi:hypothetical protein